MRKLKASTNPRSLTLSQMWKLYLMDTDELTADRVVEVLDNAYNGYSRPDPVISFQKGVEFMAGVYTEFRAVVQGMVKDGK